MLNEVDGEYTLLIVNFIYSSLQIPEDPLFYHGKQLFELRYKGFLHVILGEAFGCHPHGTGCGCPVTFPVLEVGFGQQDDDTSHLAFHATAVYHGIVGTHDGTEEVPVGNGIAVQ